MLRSDVSSQLYTPLGSRASMTSSEDQPQSLAPQPGDGHIGLVEPGGDQQRIMSPALVPDHHFTLADRDPRRGINEVTEQVSRLGHLVTPADADRKQPVQAAGHQG